MGKEEKAIEYFRNKYNCSQSVFTSFGTEYGLSEDECLKIACSFGAGMGRQQHTCGAVTGALMVLGLKYGKGVDGTEDMKQETYAKTREFFSRFIDIHGSVSCRTLLNDLDINDNDDYQKILELDLFNTNCEKYVKDAVSLVEKIT